MKTISYILVSVACSFLAVACSQKSVTIPDVSPSSQITEQTLPPAPVTAETSSSKTIPEPIADSNLQNKAGWQVDMTGSGDPLPLGFVNGRIMAYEEMLGRWQELDKQSAVLDINEDRAETMLRCYHDLQSVLSGYERMRDRKLQSYSPAENGVSAENMDTLKLDIGLLDGICGGLLGSGRDVLPDWAKGQGSMELQQIKILIGQSAAKGDYDEVISLFKQIPAEQIDQVDQETRLHYAKALMLHDEPEQAAEIYQKLVDEISSSEKEPMDLLFLRKRLGDLYTAAGNYPAAEGQLAKISEEYLAMGRIEEGSRQQLSLFQRSMSDNPELDSYAGLLRAYLGFIPERDGYKVVMQAETFLQRYPYSPVSPNVDVIKEDVQVRADKWFNTYISRIDTYLAEKNYKEALSLIKAVSPEIVSDENRLKMKEKEEAIVLAEALDREASKREMLQNIQQRWDEGMSLAEANDIDAALVIFTGLLDTEYGTRAEKKISELSLEAAKNQRRAAAEYFVRFSKATDIDTKKQMLVESRRILKNILKKYPNVDIAEKVRANVQRVENEMNQIDPMLLAEIEQEERQQALLEQQKTEQKRPEKEVDVFDLPLPSPPVPSAIRSSEPLPVNVPVQHQ